LRKVKETETELLIRFYQWALKDAEREVQSEYALLKRVQCSMVKVFLRYMSEFAPAKQLDILKVLVKRSHLEAMSRSGDRLTETEKQLADEYIQFQLGYPGRGVEEGLIPYWVPRRTVGLTPKKKIQPKKFAQTVIEKLRAVLGNHVDGHDSTTVFFENSSGKWLLQTRVYTGRPPHYFQAVRAEGRDVITTGLTSWLGIGDSAWDVLYDDQSEAAAETIGVLCAHFLDAVPILLDGLYFDPAGLLEN
jgi:hypothetical protein